MAKAESLKHKAENILPFIIPKQKPETRMFPAFAFSFML